MIINTIDGIVHRLKRKSRRVFNIVKSSSDVLELLDGRLPYIEQFSFENNKELYDFYIDFFAACKEVAR